MTDIEKVAELLKPRYKVIADYPDNQLPVGGILIKHSHIDDWLRLVGAPHGLIGIRESVPENYPHLFRKLEWWEERQESEMPDFLKYKIYDYGDNKYYIYPVQDWNLKINSVKVDKHIIDLSNYLKDKLPATKEEYESYFNYKDKQQ